jgi:dTMP kinase
MTASLVHPVPQRAVGSLFVTLEGIDGAGKSSHLEALEALLAGRGHRVVRTREPGGTPLAETLRDMILSQPMDALTESLLVFAARRDHIARVIAPALARGDVVLCDRFTDATFAYQGAGHGFDSSVLDTLERWVQGGDADQGSRAPQGPDLLQPDLTFWFDLPAETAARRLAGARVPDRFEAQPVEFFRRVASGYAARAATAPARFVRIDAAGSREQVWGQVETAIIQRLGSAA